MKQNYYDYLVVRVEFAIATALFMEFDHELELRSELHWKEWVNLTPAKMEKLKTRLVNLKWGETEKQGDLFFECMKFAPLFKQSPKVIAEKIKSYIDTVDGLDRVEVVGGYLNVYFDRVNFLEKVLTTEEI